MSHVIDRAAHVLGSQSALAAAVGVSRSAVWQWKGLGRQVPIEHCVAIERATEGAVTRRDLRPDDWQAIWPELADRVCREVPAVAAGAAHG